MKNKKIKHLFSKIKLRSYVGLGLILVLLPIILLSLVRPQGSNATWMDDSWAFRIKVPVTAHTGAETNVYFAVTIDSSDTTKFQSDCGDIRFTDANGKRLQYYIASGCSSASTVIHVLVPTFPAGASDYFMYYGNPSARNVFSSTDFTAGTGVTVGTVGSEEKGSAPVLFWNFDEGYGTTTHDVSANSNANTGTLGGSTLPVWRTEAQCVSGKCLYFDGSSSKVTGSVTMKGVKSLSFWVRPNTIATQGVINLDGGTHVISTNSSGVVTATGFTSPVYYLNGNAVTTLTLVQNQWNYVSITTGTGFDSTSSFTVGTDGTNFIKGFIDDVKFYNYQRTSSQVKAGFAALDENEGSAVAVGGGNQKFLSDGLIGYWKMDETSWTNDCSTTSVTDSSGNGNNGTACPNSTGPTGGSIGKFGNSGSFDGANDYVSIGDVSLLEFGSATSELTLSAWINPTTVSPAAAMTIMSKYNSTANREYIFQMSTNGKLTLTLSGDGAAVSSLSSTSVLTASAWSLVSVTFNAQTGATRFYINGVLDKEGTISISPIFTGTALFEIGATNKSATTPDLFWSGKIDEVRVYKRVLSPAEIRTLYNFAPGPVGYWKFDEATSTSAFDSSSNGNTGSMGAALGWTQGKYGKGINFPSSSGTCVNVGTGTNIGNLTSLTISAWINPRTEGSDSGVGRIVGKDPGYSFLVGDTAPINTTNGLTFTKGYSTTELKVQSSDNVWTANTWQYVTVTWTGGTTASSSVKMYVNGVETSYQTQQDAVGSVSADSNGLALGAFSAASCNFADFDGRMDDIKIYNYARTPQQIVEDMNGGHPTGGSPVGTQVSYWRMDEANGTTAHDSSISGNSLTLSTASWNLSGKTNTAWNGLGTNWLSRADDSDLDFAAADDFSISMWFKSDSASNPGATEYLMYKAPSGASNGGYGIYANTSGQLCFGIDDDNTSFPEDSSCSTSDVYDASWHHLTAIKNGTTQIQIFIDKRPQTADTSISATGTLANSSTLYVGDKDGADNGDEFNGDLDEVKVYRSALTTEQITIDYNAGSVLNFGVTAPTSEAAQLTDGAGNAPIGFWNFDEKTGVTAKDISGNGHDATLNGNFNNDNNSGWTAGKYGSAVHYDASNDVTQVSSSAYSLIGSGNFTVEAWVRLDTLSSSQNVRILTYQQDASNGYHLAVISSASGVCASRFVFQVDDATTYHSSGCSTTNAIAAVNTWYHLVGVYNGTTDTATLYVNSKPQIDGGSTVSLGLGEPTILTWASQSTAGTNLLDGVIDETKIYDYARTQSQISYDYNRGAPIGFWRFDECQGSTTYDTSGFGINGAITIGATGTQSSVGTCNTSSTAWGNGATGKFNSSLNLDGTDDYVTIASPSLPTGDFTYAAWVNLGTATDESIFSILDVPATSNELLVYVNASSKIQFQIDSAATTVTSTNSVSTGTWTHVAVTRAGSLMTIYINGAADPTTGSNGNALAFGSCYLLVGVDADSIGSNCNGSLGNYLDGKMDDIRIYNYALSAAQIGKLYNGGGSVNFGPSTGQP